MADPTSIQSNVSSFADLERLVAELEQRNVARQAGLQSTWQALEEQGRELRTRTAALNGRIQSLLASQPSDVLADIDRQIAKLRELPQLDDGAYRLAMLHERRQAAISRGLSLEALDESLRDYESTLQLAQARADCLDEELSDSDATQASTDTDKASGADQRRAYRVKVNTSVTLESESNVFTGFSVDLSDAGVFIATMELLAVGERVQVAVDLPSGQRIEALGEVRWVREYNEATPLIFPGVGVQFVNLSSQHKAALRAFLALREPLFYAD